MKKRKFIIASLSTLAACSLVGSLSGTIAWYQYSTRTTASIMGTDASCTDNLKMMIGYGDEADKATSDEWISELNSSDIYSYIKSTRETKTNQLKEAMDEAKTAYDNASAEEKDEKKKAHDTATAEYEAAKTLEDSKVGDVSLITNYADDGDGSLTKDGKLGTFYSNPHYQRATPSEWGIASENDYIQFPLTFKIDGGDTNNVSTALKKIFIEDLTITSDDKDQRLSDSIRVHFDSVQYTKATGTTNYEKSSESTDTLVSKNTDKTITYGPLDLNNDNQFDKKKYTYDYSTDQSYIFYGMDGSVQTSYKAEDIKPTYDVNGNIDTSTGHCLGEIPDDGYLTITVTLWLEGWHTYTKTDDSQNMTSNPLNDAMENLEKKANALETALAEYYLEDGNVDSSKESNAKVSLDEYKKAYMLFLKANTSNAQYLEAKKTVFVAAEKKDEDNKDEAKTVYKDAEDYFRLYEKGTAEKVSDLKLSDFSRECMKVTDIQDIKDELQKMEEAKNKLRTSINDAMETYDKEIENIAEIFYIWDDALKNVHFQVGMTFGI